VDALLFSGSRVAASQNLGVCFKFGCGRCWVLGHLLAEVVSVLSAEVASVVITSIARDNSTETVVGSLDGAVNEGQLSNIVLVDHAKDGFFLSHVYLGVLNFLLVGRLQLSESIVGHNAISLLLGFAVDSAKWGRKTTGAQAVYVGLMLAPDPKVWLLLVELLLVEAFLVPVLIESLV